MDNPNSFFQSKPVFFLLLPVYFVLHGFTENFDAVPLKDALQLAAVYLASSATIFFLAWLVYRNIQKAALMSFFLMAFHFFFGAVQDLLKQSQGDSFFTRYGFMIGFSSILFIVFIVFLWKTKKPLIKLCFYLNVLLFVLLLADVGWLLYKKPVSRDQMISLKQHDLSNCDTCAKPDIYFLLFDEYASSSAIKELWNYDNSDLDSFLLQNGFRIQPYSNSNYNFTPFSMASTLNMDYLPNIPHPTACTVKDYTEVAKEIKQNKVCAFLQSLGFTIINHSIFDLDKNPSLVYETFLPLKTNLITSQTFLSRVQKDLMHLLLVGKFEIKWLSKDLIYATYDNNEKLIRATLDESARTSEKPRFVYSHIEMPHPPFYFNREGKPADKKTLIEENKNLPIKSYLEYLPYTNRVIKNMVTTILRNARRPVVIIIMGDHGFRTKQPKPYHFRNQNAVYVSSGDYKGFYDSISNVNQFRVLFNNLFHTSFPLLKDSTTFLIDK